MAFEHESGIPGAHDRAKENPEWQGAVFIGDRFIQSAELNEVQTMGRARGRRVSDMVAKDGDRIEGAAAIFRVEAPEDETGQLTLTAGRIYVRGDVFPVETKVIDDVPATGAVVIGIRVRTTYVDSDENPDLLGINDGSLSQGEPGAAREIIEIEWALSDDGDEGDFFAVFAMRDGTVLDQTPPPVLDGVAQQLAIYDVGANGSYVVAGCRVTALGKTGDNQLFSIEEGEANIQGFKRTRTTALRVAVEEDFDVEEVAGEPQTWPGGASATFFTNRRPIAAINACLVTKQVTATVVRGGVAGGADALPNNSVSAIVSVVQGGTTYVAGTSYTRVGDTVSWAPGGAEPLPGSSYDVTYQYLALTVPDDWDDTSITLSGGVTGTPVILGYDWKLPRIDLMCLDRTGEAVYVKGVSARENPLPPIKPPGLLELARVTNSWMDRPAVENSGIRSVPYEEMWRIFKRVFDHERLIQLERIKSGIDAREPTAKKGIFVDPFTSDFYRDSGEVQTGSVGGGALELAITPSFFLSSLAAPVMLDYEEEVIIEQELYTGCMKINPYQVFTPLPAGLSITPAADFWTVQQTVWASPVTQQFNQGVRWDNGPLVVANETTQQVDFREQQAEFLREIEVDFLIEGFGEGEILEELTFDGIDITPAGPLVGDENGEVAGTFVIPPNVTAGSKRVRAVGGSGAEATSVFVGSGVIQTTVLRRVTTINRWEWPPVIQNVNDGGNGGGDPLAQTFTPSEARHILGVDFRLCLIGDTSNNILVHQVGVEVGIPNEDVIAEAFVPMAGATVGWKEARYRFPVVTRADRPSAFVVKTDDADHSLSIAKLGGFDAINQQWIGAQPYITGVLLSSSNAQTWTPHNDEDLAFRVIAARFTDTEKTVELGSFNLVDCSDLQVRADVELPSADCSVVFEIERPGGVIYRVLPYQVLQLTEYITETVELRAILRGTEKLSPILYPPVMLVAGEIAEEGTYVTRRFNLGTAVKLTSYLKANLPVGSTLTVEYDEGDDDWQDLPLTVTEILPDPRWVERKHEATGITATEGRIKLTITGGPAARPRVGDFGAAIM